MLRTIRLVLVIFTFDVAVVPAGTGVTAKGPHPAFLMDTRKVFEQFASPHTSHFFFLCR
jgi:hypothetical protein